MCKSKFSIYDGTDKKDHTNAFQKSKETPEDLFYPVENSDKLNGNFQIRSLLSQYFNIAIFMYSFIFFN